MILRRYEQNNTAEKKSQAHKNDIREKRQTKTKEDTHDETNINQRRKAGGRDISMEGYPVPTNIHPFPRKVIAFMKKRNEWIGTVTDLLKVIGDECTPLNTATKLLRKL